MHALWLVDTLPVGRKVAICDGRCAPVWASLELAGRRTRLFGNGTQPPSGMAADSSSASDEEPPPWVRSVCALRSWGSAERARARAWAGWMAVVAVSKRQEVASARVQWLMSWNRTVKAWCKWADVIEGRDARCKASARVARRRQRGCLASAIVEWRHVVYWRAQWRLKGPSIARRWRACILRESACGWQATVVRLKRLNAVADNFRRRRNSILCSGKFTECRPSASPGERPAEQALAPLFPQQAWASLPTRLSTFSSGRRLTFSYDSRLPARVDALHRAVFTSTENCSHCQAARASCIASCGVGDLVRCLREILVPFSRCVSGTPSAKPCPEVRLLHSLV